MEAATILTLVYFSMLPDRELEAERFQRKKEGGVANMGNLGGPIGVFSMLCAIVFWWESG
jgi:hypothetical protein